MAISHVAELAIEYPPSGDIWHKAELGHINILELKGFMAYINNMDSIKSET